MLRVFSPAVKHFFVFDSLFETGYIILHKRPTMKSICITGSQSNAGKTTLVSALLPRLRGWAACKVTVCYPHGGRGCPRGNTGCGVCDSLNEDFVIEENNEVLDQRGKDTWKYGQAGAVKVLWVKTKPEHLQRAVSAALQTLSEFPGVVFDGNHVLQVYTPDLSVMVLPSPKHAPNISTKGHYKASARKIIDKIDITASIIDDHLLDSILQRVSVPAT